MEEEVLYTVTLKNLHVKKEKILLDCVGDLILLKSKSQILVSVHYSKSAFLGKKINFFIV